MSTAGRAGFLPASTTGVEEPGRADACHPGTQSPRARLLTAAALLPVLVVAAGCTSDDARPVAPSPGVATSELPGPGGVQPPAADRTTPGITLTAVPRADGAFDVTENVLFAEATQILLLQPPAAGDQLPGLMAPTMPRVTNLKVIADDRSVPLDDAQLTGPRSVPLMAAATRIRLTYRLTGSTVRATPSRATRAGAAVRPLASSTESTLPTDVVVTSGLLNAVCPLLDESRCAVGNPPRLAIRRGIPAGRALVVLQLDLPR
ncbi:hypothetical protein [Kribbella sp. NPDC048915]|uniref:hypothetical protein n=1 Tax=Kribbella sp. NPDC048915 TaxID=3155148 RepID=UPI0033C75A5E